MIHIDRQQRTEYLGEVLPQPPNIYLNSETAAKSHLFQENETAAYHHQASAAGIADKRLYDFQVWMHNDPEVRQHITDDTLVFDLLPAYGNAIQKERERVAGVIEELRPKFGQRLDQLAASGDIPSVLAERFREGPQATHLRLGMADSSHGRHGSAFYLPGAHTAYYRPWMSTKALGGSYTHESFHGLSGSSLHKHGKTVYSSRTGLGTDVVGAEGYKGIGQRHRVLNEGITEYLTNLAIYGLPGEISPADRGERDTGSYKTEREIVQLIADHVGLDTLLNAYAADYDPKNPDAAELRELMRTVREQFGAGFLHKLDKLDAEEGPERALDFTRAADYLAKNRQANTKGQRKIGKLLSKKHRNH